MYYFFDTSALISAYLPNQQYHAEMRAFYGTALEESGGGFQAHHLVISSLLPYELVKAFVYKNKDPTKPSVELDSFQRIDITKEILTSAIKFMEEYKLKSFDAIQLACALKAKSLYNELLFVSTDKKLLKAANAEGLLIQKFNE